MLVHPSPAASFLRRACIATALVSVGLPAFAGSTLERIQQRGVVTVGIGHLPPAYATGKKFRTPETLDAALADQVARQLRVPLATLPDATANRAGLLKAGKADMVLAAVSDEDPLQRTATLIPTGYTSGPMAIMRSDTDIKDWIQLKGRTVCVARDGRYVDTLAHRFGAIEIVYPSVTDSLLALRTGGCDAAVHDNTLLEELIRLPEWKKFSAQLPVTRRMPLVFAIAKDAASLQAVLQQLARTWQHNSFLTRQIKTAARNIAFEVYLDQDVPDCH